MRNNNHRDFVIVLASLSLSLASARAINFTDDFEGATLNSFWTVTNASGGSVLLPSVAQAHGGRQSVRFSLPGGVSGQAFLRHNFSELSYGTVSVWGFDPGPGGGANYLGLYLGSPTNAMNLQAIMWDSEWYYYQIYTKSYATPVPRTRAWHQWTITSTSTALTMAIDGTPVYEGPGGMPFDSVRIGTYGMAAETSLAFDDFSIAAAPISNPRPIIRLSQVEVCWESLTNKTYQVQYSLALMSNIWVNLGGPVAGNGSTNCVTDALTCSHRYYRVVASP